MKHFKSVCVSIVCNGKPLCVRVRTAYICLAGRQPEDVVLKNLLALGVAFQHYFL